jgi:hypothetical protein
VIDDVETGSGQDGWHETTEALPRRAGSVNRLRGRGGWVDLLIVREQEKPGAEDRGGVPVFSYSSGLPVAPEPISRALGRYCSRPLTLRPLVRSPSV